MTRQMCGVPAVQKRKGMVAMLSGSALAYYATHPKDAKKHEKVTSGLVLQLTSEKKILDFFYMTKRFVIIMPQNVS